jgi:hypothetical protein
MTAIPVPIHFQRISKHILQHLPADLFKKFKGLLKPVIVGHILSPVKVELLDLVLNRNGLSIFLKK